MQAVYARYRFERRLLIDGMLWTIAWAGAWFLAQRAGMSALLPTSVQLRLSHVPVQQFSDAFPAFAAIIALSTLCIWGLRCGRNGAAVLCAAWMMLGLSFEFARRPDVSSWILPELPSFFHTIWPFRLLDSVLGNGGFNINSIVAIVLGGIIAYVMVLNSIPNRCRA